MGVEERVANVKAVNRRVKRDFLTENHAANTVGPSGHLFPFKRGDVLVSFRAVIVALVLVDTKVEFCSVLYDCFVER